MIAGRGMAYLILVSLLAGCPAGGDGGGGGNLVARLAAACDRTSNLGKALCDCVAEEADTDLSDTSLRLLVAMLEQDTAAANTVRRDASLEDATSAATFMTRGPATCARRGIAAEPAP
jgi:hypothetical protein